MFYEGMNSQAHGNWTELHCKSQEWLLYENIGNAWELWMLVGKFQLKGTNLGMARAIIDFLVIPHKKGACSSRYDLREEEK